MLQHLNIPAANEVSWYLKPLNILQTNIREIDANTYNAKAISICRTMPVNALGINVGGIVGRRQYTC